MENNNCDLQCTSTHTTLSDIQSATWDVATVVPMNQSSDDSTSDQPAVQVEPGGGSIKSATSEITTCQKAAVWQDDGIRPQHQVKSSQLHDGAVCVGGMMKAVNRHCKVSRDNGQFDWLCQFQISVCQQMLATCKCTLPDVILIVLHNAVEWIDKWKVIGVHSTPRCIHIYATSATRPLPTNHTGTFVTH